MHSHSSKLVYLQRLYLVSSPLQYILQDICFIKMILLKLSLNWNELYMNYFSCDCLLRTVHFNAKSLWSVL